MRNNEVGVGMGVSSGGLLMWLSTLSVAEWSYMIGAFVAVASLVYGFYFAWKKNKRDQEEHDIKMETLRRGITEPDS